MTLQSDVLAADTLHDVQVRGLQVPGSWLFTPHIHSDPRGIFLEAFTQSSFQEAVGQALTVKQTNISVSSQGTIRGIHFADVPPGQAKYVQCVEGLILDVVVDLRVDSPTFAQWEAVNLDSRTRQALYLAEGLGHAFCALSPTATVGYMCSEPYSPEREHGVHPLDPDLSIDWPEGLELHLSARDAAAPSMAAAVKAGILPKWDICQDFTARLAERWC